MAYDHDLADRVRELMPVDADHDEKAMFGGLAFLVGGNMAVAVSGRGGLMVRIDPADNERLRRSKGVGPMVMAGRETEGWVRVDADAVRTTRQLTRWVGIGLDHASTLPPKTAKAAGKARRR